MSKKPSAFLLILCFMVTAGGQVAAQECDKQFDSTFELIQEAIFENRGCTATACHGTDAAGGLQLTADVAFDNLVDQKSTTIPDGTIAGLMRVVPAYKARSLLWLNLASATLPEQWDTPLRSMPQGGLPPLSLNELEVVRLWIEHGAPRDGVIAETAELLDACLPKPGPIAVEPLAPPPASEGVQLKSPRQILPPESEREVCFVSYYDLTDRVPEEFWSPDGQSFRIKGIVERQDPLSHHAIVNAYDGVASIDDPVWGEFTCVGGPRDGQSCAPRDPDSCGEGYVCGSEPANAVTCIGFGPGDAGVGAAEETLFSTMEASLEGLGLYREVPLEGILIWNSHAFNLADEPAKLDIWVNLLFASPEEQLYELIKVTDASGIHLMRPPAFGVDEVCHREVFPIGANVVTMGSHAHQRGKRFRVFDGHFACNGGPRDGAACSPFGPDPDFPAPDLCGGANCESILPPRVGDCDGDLTITVGELTTGIGIALGSADIDRCPRFDPDGDSEVTVTDIVAAVDAALNRVLRDPEDSLFYVSLTYSDPTVLTFDPPRYYPAHSVAQERTVTYCGLYDNGFTDPTEVKRRSETPTNGYPCKPTHCAEGAVGTPCVGSTQEERDRSCDATDEAGFCDACTVGIGLTTEDEMFVLLYSYYVD